MAGSPPAVWRLASERTANVVAVAIAGATALRNSVSRSVKSQLVRTMPAAPAGPVGQEQHSKLLIDPSGRQTLLNLTLRLRSRSGKSHNLAIGSLRACEGGKPMRLVG
jgi:hypothetical protein